jgi:hypothetical protein
MLDSRATSAWAKCLWVLNGYWKARHKSPAIDQIAAELIKAGGRTIHFKTHKLINSISNQEELPEKWKKSIIVPIHKKGDETDCSNYTVLSLLSTTYTIISRILL